MNNYRCARCTMTRFRPDVPFNEEGICQACINWENRRQIDWAERREALIKLLDRFDGRCLVPSSGGKDSHYQVLALRELGADVTTVTAMTCMPTAIGLANLNNLERYAPGIRVEPDRKHRPKLNRLGLEMVGDISWPEHVAIFTVPFRTAVDTGHKLLFYGENPQDQYGGPLGSEQAKTLTQRWRSEFGGFLGLRPSDMAMMISEAALEPYTLPPEEKMRDIEAHFLGAYLPWDGFSNAKIANKAGMRQVLPSPANWHISENNDNAQTGLHDYFGYLKYGYGRGCAQISMDIRAGRVTRERAVEWIREYDGLFPHKYMGVLFEDVIDYIGMSPAQFYETRRQFTNPALFRIHEDPSRKPMLAEFCGPG